MATLLERLDQLEKGSPDRKDKKKEDQAAIAPLTRRGISSAERAGLKKLVETAQSAKTWTRWLPPARITHPWPEERIDVRTRGKSPVR